MLTKWGNSFLCSSCSTGVHVFSFSPSLARSASLSHRCFCFLWKLCAMTSALWENFGSSSFNAALLLCKLYTSLLLQPQASHGLCSMYNVTDFDSSVSAEHHSLRWEFSLAQRSAHTHMHTLRFWPNNNNNNNDEFVGVHAAVVYSCHIPYIKLIYLFCLYLFRPFVWLNKITCFYYDEKME